jgi:hypothetical protein
MPLKNIPFFVDGHFRDREQGYTVLELSDNGMKIRYDDGTTETLDADRVQIKARIYTNILGEYRRLHPITTEAYFETLGYLSRHGRFEGEFPPKSVGNFLIGYERLTGERVNETHKGIFLLGDGDKWGAELRIYFPDTQHKLEFDPGVEVRAGNQPGVSRINNNAFWMRLIAMGFRLDTGHDVDQIRKNIPPEKLASFEKGRTY